jgi:hypothetical protein
MTSLITTKGMSTVLSEGTPLVPFVAGLSASLFLGIPRCPGIHTKVTSLDPLSFSSACILCRTRTDWVVAVASAAIAALLSEQIVSYRKCRKMFLFKGTVLARILFF